MKQYVAAGEANVGESKAVRRAREVHVNILLLAHRTLDQVEEICQTEGTTHSQYTALWTLCLAEAADEGIPASAVTDGLLNRASDTSRLIDRLERAGLAERLPNPTDRRGILVRATAEGRKRFQAITPKLQAFHATQWSNLTAAETASFGKLMGKALWGQRTPEAS